MNWKVLYQLLFRLIAVGMLGATFSCGPGSGTPFLGGGIDGTGDASPTIDEGGTPGRGISVGTITGFGSVIVNGVEFDTDNAVITVEIGRAHV